MNKDGWLGSLHAMFGARDASPTTRLVASALMMLLLQVPISLIDHTVSERRLTREAAHAEVAARVGGAETLLGPVLSVPVVRQLKGEDGKLHEVRSIQHILPTVLEIRGHTRTEIRRRGIFGVPLFNADITLAGRFDTTQVALNDAGAGPADIRWAEAEICVGMSDPRTIRSTAPVAIGTTRAAFGAGSGDCEFNEGGIHARVQLSAGDQRDCPFTVNLTLAGSQRLAFVPVGAETSVRLEGDAPDVSFDGAFLPLTHETGPAGFRAEWRVLQLNHGFPSVFGRGELGQSRLDGSSFGITWVSASDAYRATSRAVKYQLLFLGLTGTLLFLFELLGGARVHPVQYLLIGSGLCLFYLLLLALSEHVGFAVAYAVAAGAITALIGGYGRAVLGRHRRTITLVALLAALYAMLFVLLKIEDYALLVGSIGLLVLLAAVMFFTRRVDWYQRAT
jgi:inner membrane protein